MQPAAQTRMAWRPSATWMRSITRATPRPSTTPSTPPTPNCTTSRHASALAVRPSGAVIHSISVRVRKIAMGSLMPDSISSTLATRSLSRMPLPLSSENTAAASVEPTMAPSSRPSFQSMPSIHAANSPTSTAVMPTPTVASDSDGRSATRKVAKRVRSPPSSRITASAILPTRKLSQVLAKRMPPGPSTPASMPTARNTSRNGMPKRAENTPSRMPSVITTAPIRMAWSILSKRFLSMRHAAPGGVRPMIAHAPPPSPPPSLPPSLPVPAATPPPDTPPRKFPCLVNDLRSAFGQLSTDFQTSA
ncbi:hypothetical protein D3C87_1255740 [compost metagenome]